MKKNYKSDFDLILRLLTCSPDGADSEPRELGWPDFDWTARFYTDNRANVYVASCIGGECVNCFEDDGEIHVVFNDHRLSKGALQVEFSAEFPDEIYPDGHRLEVSPQSLDVELVSGRGDCGTMADVQLMLPYIKFKYEDLTPEEKAEISKPATEAAASVAQLEKSVEAAEEERVRNETARAKAEAARVSAEQTRQSNELERVKAEAEREEAEEERKDAETKRAEEFAEWETEIDSKADKAELSNVLAEEPLTSDNFPDINTYTREELKMDLFIDMWNSACGQYGKYVPEEAPDAEHPFLLNGLWLTYEEALATYYTPIESRGEYLAKYLSNVTLRTNICTYKTVYWLPVDIYNIARSATNMEVIRLSTNDAGGVYVSANDSAFSGAKKLRAIYPFIVDAYSGLSAYAWLNTFRNCPMLEDVQIKNLKYSLDFRESPRLSLASLQYIVANAANTAAITITVHPEVYAKLNDETDAEWHALVAQGAEKNINFATV